MFTLKESVADAVQILIDTLMCKEPEAGKTGFPELDNLTRGMRRGTLTVLAAPPSLGKTAFALNIVGNLMDGKPEIPILYCSKLSHTELTFRLLTVISGAACGYDGDRLADDLPRLTECVAEKRNYPLFFEECGTADGDFAVIAGLCAEKHIGFLIFDPARPESLAKLKRLARELDIPVLALVSSRRDKSLTAITEPADTVIRLVRDRHGTKTDRGAPVELVVVRNRCGLCGACRMNFHPRTMRFREIDSEAGEET